MNDHFTPATGEKMRLPAGGPPEPPSGPLRLPRKEKFDVATVAIPAFAVATGAMVGLSAPQLIDPSGFTGWLKISLLTTSSALVSYIVNRYAIEQGAELTARGYLSAGVASVGSILIVGGGLFASTYAGLTLPRVNDLKLQHHGQALVQFVDESHAQVSKAVQVKPAIDAAVADIQLHLACEEKESCLSGRARGGRGPVTRGLEPVATRASEISAQLQKGDAARTDQLARLNSLIGQYQTTFADTSTERAERRRTLSRIDARIKQEVSALGEAMPVSLLRAYGDELDKGQTIAGRPEATSNINALLRRHARTISASLESVSTKAIEVPAFPQEAGVSSTFSYIGHFLPIAALTAVIELVMPLTLWVYMLLAHLWGIYQKDPTDPPRRSRASQPKGGRDAG